MTTMRTIPKAFVLCALTAILARMGAAEWVQRHPPRIEDRVSWRESWDDARRESLASGKPILLDFTAAWCRPCERLAAEVFCDEDLARRINAAFVPFRVEDDPDSARDDEMQEQFRVRGFPTLLVVMPAPYPPRELSGYSGGRLTMLFLEESRVLALRARKVSAP